MSNWKLTLSYDGGHFHGWQVQPGLVTVQGALAEAISHVTGETVLPQGSGRTDAGVHALGQVASFTLQAPVPPANFLRALNRVLPQSIRVLSAEEAPESFHARHSARGKTYEYRLFERRIQVPGETFARERICSPFLAPYAWDCRWPLSLDAMNEAAAHFLGAHDFTALAATDPDKTLRDEDDDNDRKPSRPNPVKTIFSSTWRRTETHSDPWPLGPEPWAPSQLAGCGGEPLLLYRVTGSGFLHHMVRNLVGTMVDVGRGSLRPEDIPQILASRDRSTAGPTAPARGLYLVHVNYDEASE